MRRFRQPQAGGGAGDIGDANAWTLTSIVDVPTGVAVGDYGVLADRVYQYTSLTVDAGAGGGTLLAWVPPDVAAWTSPTVYGYLTGDEDGTARGNQGWTDSVSGTGSVTGDNAGSGYTRVAAGSGSNSATIQTIVSAVTSGTKVYARAEVRAQGDAAGSNVGAIVADGSNIVRAYQRLTTQAFSLNNNGGTILSPGALRSSGSILPSVTPDLIEVIDYGRTVLCDIVRNGEQYHADKRTGGTSSANYAGYTATTFSASVGAWIDLRRVLVIGGT